MDQDIARYSTDVAAAAAGLGLPLLRSWEKKGLSLLSPEYGDVRGRRGTKNLYTWRGVIRLALVAELHRWGMAVETALATAIEFTDLASGEAGYPGDNRPIDRFPGELFKSGRTLLRIADRSSPGELLNVDSTAGNGLALPIGMLDKGILAIDLEAFIASVDAELKAAERGKA